MQRQTEASAIGGVPGFPPDAFAFLTELAEAQSREWFLANKARYESSVRGPMMALIAGLSEALAEREIPLQGDPQRSMFRINRDIRFGLDKRPYKTHAGAVLTRNGEKASPGVLYVHIDPAGSFTAAGFYHAEPERMALIRRAIASRKSEFREMLGALDRAGLALRPDEDALKRTPRGFEGVTDPLLVAALRCKSWIVQRGLGADEVGKPVLVDTVADFAEAAMPLLRFGWDALGV